MHDVCVTSIVIHRESFTVAFVDMQTKVQQIIKKRIIMVSYSHLPLLRFIGAG